MWCCVRCRQLDFLGETDKRFPHTLALQADDVEVDSRWVCSCGQGVEQGRGGYQ